MEITPQCVVGSPGPSRTRWARNSTCLVRAGRVPGRRRRSVRQDRNALQGHEAGAQVELQLEPEEAFGDFNDRLVFLGARACSLKDIEEGMTFEGHCAAGRLRPGRCPRTRCYTVTEIYPEHVVLDGNHPLAGIALRLSLKVESVREASEEEIGARHRRHRLLQGAGAGATRLHWRARPDADTALRA
jgi:FKBP-type peptidyl-prolyl cis-trans isomerase SlyD